MRSYAMRKVSIAMLLSSLFLAVCAFAQTTVAETSAITHVTVIDGTGAPPKTDMTVLIAANRIARISPSRETRFSKETREIDGTGKFLIPGLWDMHVHLIGKGYLPLFTANGITGIRIMSGQPDYLQWRKEIESGTLMGPRMSIASPLVDGIQEPPGSPRGKKIVVHTAAEAREAVQKIKQDGYDFVKVYSSLSREAYFAIEDESKRLGISFVGHVPDSITAWEASDAGQRSIEHLEGIVQDCSNLEDRRQAKTHAEAYNPGKCAKLFEEFRKNLTWQCPTLTALHLNALVADDPALKNDPRLKYVPQPLLQYWLMTIGGHASAEEVANGKAYFQVRQKIAGALQRDGVDLLAGTDAPNPFVFPGFGLHDELALLVEGGLTPMQALQAATRNPARFLGMEKDAGTVEAGKLADLVLINDNPLTDIHNTQKIFAVVQNGEVIARPELDRMLTDAAATAARGTMPQR
jgi:imidazolonepropionase-like amidohydrolase